MGVNTKLIVNGGA